MKKETIKQEVVRYNPQFKDGLNNEQIEERIKNGLINKTKEKGGKSYLQIILKNVITVFNLLYVLITLLLISAHKSSPQETFSITNFTFIIIITINLLIGTIQEIRAKKTVNKLKLLSANKVKVIRNGEITEIEVDEVVLDDIVYLSSGKEIVADGIVVEGSVEVNESQLTGESVAIRKEIGDFLFSGSFVVSGYCHAKVECVGEDNAIEKLTESAKQYRQPKSQILITLNTLIKFITIFLIFSGFFMIFSSYDFRDFFGVDTKFANFVYDKVYLGFLHKIPFFRNANSSWFNSVTTTCTALLGMIPAGLIMMTSAALVLGVIRLSKHQTLVQDIYCVEMLARVDVLCLDKTGTITDGTMNVVFYEELQKSKKDEYDIPKIIANMNAAFADPNSTQKALEQYFGVDGSKKPDDIIPFSSERKYSACRFKQTTYIIGAPEFVLKSGYDKYAEELNNKANKGYRILCLAETNQDLVKGSLTRSPKPLAFIYIEDQIRKEAIDTINYFTNNGVEVKVISGDNPITVSNVACRVGIKNAERFISLDGLNEDEVYDAATKYTVFGRVKPEQKQIIVKALKDKKKTVAMTGDGVNDILALKEADCSIAMASGSEAVRSIAQLVLLDSNFASMPKVVAEGRRAINNIQKIAVLYLMKTFFVLMLAFLTIAGFFKAVSGDGTFPFSNPSQLLLFEMFVIGIPGIFLTIQPNHDIVKGRFLGNILKKAIPASMTIVICIVLAYVLSKICGLEISTTKTIVAVSTTFIGLLILFKECSPFDLKRTILYGLMVFACTFFLTQSMFKTPYLGFISEGVSESIPLDNLFDNYIISPTNEKASIIDDVKVTLINYTNDYNNIESDIKKREKYSVEELHLLENANSVLNSLKNSPNYHLNEIINFFDEYKEFYNLNSEEELLIESKINTLEQIKKESKVNLVPFLLIVSFVAMSLFIMKICSGIINIITEFFENRKKPLEAEVIDDISAFIDEQNNL